MAMGARRRRATQDGGPTFRESASVVGSLTRFVRYPIWSRAV